MADYNELYNQMEDAVEDLSASSVEMKGMMTADDATDVNIEGYGPKPSFSKQIKLLAQTIAPLGPQYSSLADAQAAVTSGAIPDGGYAYIRSSSDESLADEYRNNAGTLQATGKTVPSQKALTELETFVRDTVAQMLATGGASALEGFLSTAWAWVDAEGKSLQEILSDGTTNVPALLIGDKIEFVAENNGGLVCQVRGTAQTIFRLSTTGSFTVGNTTAWVTDETFFEGYKVAWMDAEGKIYKAQLADGSIVDATSDSDGGSDSSQYPAVAAVDGNIIAVDKDQVTQITNDTGVNNTGPVAHKNFIRYISDISGQYQVNRSSYDGKYRARESLRYLIHIILTGQSLAAGGSTQSVPPVTTSAQADYGILCFATGPKVDFAYQTLDTSLLESVIPCRENAGVRPGQESPSSGIAWQVHSRTGHTVLVSDPCASGTAIAGISAGTTTFTAATAMIEAGAAMAEKLGLEYLPVLVLIHGNANAAAGTSIANYQAAMETLRLQYENVINNAIEGAYSLPMFVGQLSNIIPYGGTAGTTKTNNIGIAQYQEARDNPLIHLASAQYARPYSDGEHLTAPGYRTEGEVIGAIIGDWLKDSETTALIPDQANTVQSGTTITIPVKGVSNSLVIDSTRVTDPGNYGFVLTGATIASVAVSGSNIVITKTDSTHATRISYAATGIAGQNPGALTGSRGCIRDSQTGTSLSGLPLYKDLCVFAFDL